MALIKTRSPQNMIMNGVDMNGEWSDGSDVVKSGSATDWADGEAEDLFIQKPLLNPPKAFNSRFDPVTMILDKIDNELSNLSRSKSLTSSRPESSLAKSLSRSLSPVNRSPVIFTSLNKVPEKISPLNRPPSPLNRTPSPLNRAPSPLNRAQSPLNRSQSSLTKSQSSTATGSTVVRRPGSRTSDKDRLDTEDLTTGHLDKSGSHRSGSSKDGADTGLGSLQDEPPLSDTEQKISGSAEVYSDNANVTEDEEPNKKGGNVSDLDSVAAQQIDEKFKEIMRKKKGGYLSNLKSTVETSDDAETIKTEDFEDMFRETMVYQSDSRHLGRPVRPSSASPLNSHSDHDVYRPKRKCLTPPVRFRPDSSSTPPVYPKSKPDTIQHGRQSPSRRNLAMGRAGNVSDADSIKTEDFETRFYMMRNQTRTDVPQSDSDADVTHDALHTKVQQVLRASAQYRGAESGSEPELEKEINTRNSEQNRKAPVRMPAEAPQVAVQEPDGAESEGTLCSDKEEMNNTVLDRTERVTNPSETESVREARQEIEQESIRIQKELHRERRSQSMSPARERRSPTRELSSSTHSMRSSPKNSVIFASPVKSSKELPVNGYTEHKESKSDETYRLQSKLDLIHTDLKDAETVLKETREKAEDARTQLMLTEFKRDNTMKELERVNDELNRQRKQMKSYENQVNAKLDEIRSMDSVGMTKEEAMTILEENDSLKARQRNWDAVQLERDELVRQLEVAKEGLFNEQKHGRANKEELQEEVENLSHQLEEVKSREEEASNKLHKLESGFKKMEKEKNEVIHEKTILYDDMKEKTKQERVESRKRSTQELEGLREEVNDLSRKIDVLQDEINQKEHVNVTLRDQMQELERDLSKEQSAREAIMNDHKKTLQSLRKDTDSAMVKLREALFLEKQQAQENLRDELEQERRDATARAEERLQQQLSEHTHQLTVKNQELQRLQELVRKLEEERQQIEMEMKKEAKEQVREALNHERQVLESERDWAIRREKELYQAESNQKIKELVDQIEQERKLKDILLHQVKEHKKEIDDHKQQTRQAVHDRLVNVARAKDMVRQDCQSEMDRIKEKLVKDHQEEIEKLRETVQLQEQELRQHRAEKHERLRQERESAVTLDRTERTLVNEINEECRRSGNLLGILPRKVQLANFRADSNGIQSPRRNPTTAALANLRACNEELRSHCLELKQDVDNLKAAQVQAAQDKEEALQTLKRQLEKEKHFELEKLKERLIKGLSTTEYHNLLYTPDNDVASLQQSKQQKTQQQWKQTNDAQQSEIERMEREVQRLAMNQHRIMSRQSQPPAEELNNARSIQQLQSKIKQIQLENTGLRHARLSPAHSVPDLSNPVYYTRVPTQRPMSPSRDDQMVQALEKRMKEVQMESVTAAEQQNRSRNVMSQKMMEMTKLQNHLTNQTKELMQLERAYTHLNSQYGRSQAPVVNTVR